MCLVWPDIETIQLCNDKTSEWLVILENGKQLSQLQSRGVEFSLQLSQTRETCEICGTNFSISTIELNLPFLYLFFSYIYMDMA